MVPQDQAKLSEAELVSTLPSGKVSRRGSQPRPKDQKTRMMRWNRIMGHNRMICLGWHDRKLVSVLLTLVVLQNVEKLSIFINVQFEGLPRSG